MSAGTWNTHHQSVSSCALSENDVISDVIVHTKWNIVSGLVIITQNTTCELFITENTEIDAVHRVSGHQLLYVSGRLGVYMDKITLHFDYGCRKVTDDM